MSRRILLALALALAASSGTATRAEAQQGVTQDRSRAAQEQPGAHGFEQYLYPPDLVMRHQRELALEQGQEEAITRYIGELQAHVVELQWRMAGDGERLTDLLRQTVVDEAAVLEQLDRILETEHEVKRTQFTMLIRIRNTLSAEQRATLNGLRDEIERR